MLDHYVTLGRSGLRVSPLCLGTMTFGTQRGWGATEDVSAAMFDLYVERGGNFFDTADVYTNGQSETMLGKFIAERQLRDRAVIATKFTLSLDPTNPNASGNGRKNIYRALDASLKRLGTDYVDLYWLHAWDGITPIEEVLGTLDDLVRAGKIRYFGLSDVPAWYASRMHTIAEKDGRNSLVALQLGYSLLERGIEREHVPAARELGWGICPWSPLASGLLTGKYAGADKSPEWRLTHSPDHVVNLLKPEHVDPIVAANVALAGQLGVSPAQVALRWVMDQPGVTSVILGARDTAQLEDNLGAMSVTIDAAQSATLHPDASPDMTQPYFFFREPWTTRINGKKPVVGWR